MNTVGASHHICDEKTTRFAMNHSLSFILSLFSHIDIHTNSQMYVRAHITLTQIGTHTTRMYSQYSVRICEWQDIYRFGSKYSCLIFPAGFELIKPTVNIV